VKTSEAKALYEHINAVFAEEHGKGCKAMSELEIALYRAVARCRLAHLKTHVERVEPQDALDFVNCCRLAWNDALRESAREGMH
jgi:hypothetical protein